MGGLTQPATTAPIKVALIGRGIGASLTPAMHEAEGRALGLDYRYETFDTKADALKSMTLAEIVEMAEASGYAGVNITHPFKAEVIPLLDDISDMARLIGSVNTVIFRDGSRIGDNTDYSGFRAGYTCQLRNSPKAAVLLLGAGGAGASVAFALIDEGVGALNIYDKHIERSKMLAQKLSKARPNAVILPVSDLVDFDLSEVDGIVNTTPMGMKDYPGTAIDTNLISPDAWVADIVYFPMETDLLAQAKARGCNVMNGTGMAIHQAAKAFELITGQHAVDRRFKASFERIMAERKQQKVNDND